MQIGLPDTRKSPDTSVILVFCVEFKDCHQYGNPRCSAYLFWTHATLLISRLFLEANCILGNHISRTGVKVFAMCPGLTHTKLLSNAPANAINDRFAQEYADEIEGSRPQKVISMLYRKCVFIPIFFQASSVAKGLADILDTAEPGSVWVVENDGSPYEVTYPGNVLDMKKEKKKEQKSSATIRN